MPIWSAARRVGAARRDQATTNTPGGAPTNKTNAAIWSSPASESPRTREHEFDRSITRTKRRGPQKRWSALPAVRICSRRPGCRCSPAPVRGLEAAHRVWVGVPLHDLRGGACIDFYVRATWEFPKTAELRSTQAPWLTQPQRLDWQARYFRAIICPSVI